MCKYAFKNVIALYDEAPCVRTPAACVCMYVGGGGGGDMWICFCELECVCEHARVLTVF